MKINVVKIALPHKKPKTVTLENKLLALWNQKIMTPYFSRQKSSNMKNILRKISNNNLN